MAAMGPICKARTGLLITHDMKDDTQETCTQDIGLEENILISSEVAVMNQRDICAVMLENVLMQGRKGVKTASSTSTLWNSVTRFRTATLTIPMRVNRLYYGSPVLAEIVIVRHPRGRVAGGPVGHAGHFTCTWSPWRIWSTCRVTCGQSGHLTTGPRGPLGAPGTS